MVANNTFLKLLKLKNKKRMQKFHFMKLKYGGLPNLATE